MKRKFLQPRLLAALTLWSAFLTSVASAAVPAITAATLRDGKLMIAGSNFGDKQTPGPYRFWTFASDADGTSSTAAGFDFYNSGESIATVVSGDGVGGKALKFTAKGVGLASDAGKFPMIGETLPQGTMGVLCSVWFKLHRQGPTVSGGTLQWKGPRTGVYSSNPSSPEQNYAASPHLSASVFTAPDFVWASGVNSSGFNSYIDYEFPGAGSAAFNSPDPGLALDKWFHWEVWYKFNDLGAANGEMIHTLNGKEIARLSNLRNRTASEQSLQHIIVLTGLAFLQNRDWDIYMSRVYLDTTKSHVFVCDSESLTGCSGRFVLPPTAWNMGSIEISDVTGVPAGYKWLYVSNSAGETNATGFPLAAGSIPMPPVATVD